MIFKTKQLFVLTFVLSFGLLSCNDLTEVSKLKDGTDGTVDGDDLPASNKGKSNQVVNNWIYANMEAYYLWGNNMPAKSATNLNLTPDKYFSSILYQYGEVDRFSWIEEDAVALAQSLQGITKSAGFSYTPFLTEQGGTDVIFAVRYSIKGSPAEKAGLVRGDIISKVNGVQITTSNYQQILSPESLVFTLAERSSSGGFVSTTKAVAVTKAVIQNYPVHFTSIIEAGNKKVGYLVYNQFIRGIGSNAQFDDELRAAFANFKTNGVTELVLDLRFNGGGLISSSEVLSSLIVKDLKPGTLMSKQVWSDNAKKIFNLAESAYESRWANEANNLGTLNRVFVLTSNGTASASELVINNLLPFMDVVLIGTNTYGKDVGSVTLDDEENNYRWKWGLQPIVLRTVNAAGEAKYGTKAGFVPTYEVADNVIPFRPYGDPNETLLKVALEKISGVTTTARARNAASSALPILGEGGGFDNPRNNISDMYLDKYPQ